MFVLDCSVTMPWILKNDPTGYAEKILQRLSKESVISCWYASAETI